MPSLEVGDFPKGRPRIWVVSSNARRRISFIEVLCILFLRARRFWLGFPVSFIRRAFSFSIEFWSRWLFLFFSGILAGLFIFVLTAKCGSTFHGRMTFTFMEGIVFVGIVLSLRIRVDGSAGVVTLILPYWVTETRLLNGSRSRWSLILGCQYFFGLVVRFLFRPACCNSGFAEACSAAEVAVSSLPCSVRIERSGSLEYGRLRYFEDLVFPLMDQTAVGFILWL
ncbi:hypothetical protein F2Q68_00031034 [Brassica cretica]|uniref:Uncharacterized protein n=1 Tax=Brassica cretica TaxID=69181 RepID=A0A8S9G8V5_BRACR|nr:hypothetical protein F2Q68_00031034 [Brassica cretica]